MPKPRLQIDGHTFRDLNNNGKLDIYVSAPAYRGASRRFAVTDESRRKGRHHVPPHDSSR